MTQDEIIVMANAAAARHGHTYEPEPADGTVEFLASFAAVVAAKEREACAQVCEANRTNPPQGKSDDVERGFNAAIRRCAAAIRARGTKECA